MMANQISAGVDSVGINRTLARANLVTALGDYVSLFAILVLMHQQTGSIRIAAYAVPLHSLGIALGGALFPSAASWWSLRAILVGSQIASAAVIGLVAIFVGRFSSPWPIYTLLVLHSVLKQSFDGARESYSKTLASPKEHRTFQAELVHALYSAQIVGPALSVLVIHLVGAVLPLWLDALSFLAAGWMCWRLPSAGAPQRYQLLRPITYLSKNPVLLRIFLLRSVGYWIPVGLFNYLLFTVAFERYGTGTDNLAWTYVAIAVGSVISTQILRANRGWVSRFSDAAIAAGALAFLAVTRIAFISVPSFGWALAVLVIGGLSNGANAVTTQSIRRKATTDAQFPEVVGLEIVVGRLTEWVSATVMLFAMTRTGVSFEAGIVASAICLLVLAGLHASKMLRSVG